MRLFGKNTKVQPCVATIGSFDGVHMGHQFVIQQVVRQARQRGLASLVVTFPNHPKQVLHPGFVPQMLSPNEEKIELLQQTEIDRIALVEFTPQLALLTAREFMQTILHDQLQVKVLLIGYDNHFGHDHKTFAHYVEYGQAMGIEVLLCDEMPGGYSSTTIRTALLTGRTDTANDLLGHPYTLQGQVVEGFQNGRRLGYPTANLQVSPLKLIPQNGVYLAATPHGHGMLNIGNRPTLHNGPQRSIEVHIFDFRGDLYGQMLSVQILHHLRPEREFPTLEALQQQLEADEKACRQLSSQCHRASHCTEHRIITAPSTDF